MIPATAKFALAAAMLFGYAAGKIDADVRIRELMHAQQMRIANMNATAIADALESRKLAVIPKDTPKVTNGS
jgi:hypothetical protein